MNGPRYVVTYICTAYPYRVVKVVHSSHTDIALMAPDEVPLMAVVVDRDTGKVTVHVVRTETVADLVFIEGDLRE